MARGFVYLAVVLDWATRRVLSWRLSITMEAAFSAIHRIIENPVYGGAYAYGKTAVAAGYTAKGVSV